ncbi:phage minor tail protein L [Methylorubrum extorquens]|uniref:phage minor tail protein L n=1 Tax=Methylorubrum extorquens TaxID=408 RepID=UPI00209D8755|nr:phage minor tail protein L [Methylorubrum extorquens]MCP1540054.1 lambda family phage minor tail protein L [Methylorubrum extorquens]
MSSIHANVQSGSFGNQVFLFRMDATAIGGRVYYFAQAAHADGNVKFGGVEYTAVDFDFDNYETSAQGALPQPKIRFSNTNEVIQGLVNTFGDGLIGCPVQRVRTYAQYLDGAEEADPQAFYGPDTFEIEQLSDENPVYIEFELSAAFDQQGRKLPGRQMLRDTCLARYRAFKGGAFDYSKASCPYTGGACFTRMGEPTNDPSKDACGRRLSDCEKRFGKGNSLPTWSFPGMARVRQS